MLLVETIFDTLNAKAAMFAIDKFFEKWGKKISRVRFRHHRRQLRAHAVRPDERGVLELREPLQADRDRAELRPRREGHGAVHREPEQGCGLLGVLLPQRRASQRDGRVRPEGPGDGGGLPRVPGEGTSSTPSAGAAAPRTSTSGALAEMVSKFKPSREARRQGHHATLRSSAVQLRPEMSTTTGRRSSTSASGATSQGLRSSRRPSSTATTRRRSPSRSSRWRTART